MESGELVVLFLRNGELVVRNVGIVLENLLIVNPKPKRFVRTLKQRNAFAFGNVREIRRIRLGRCRLSSNETGRGGGVFRMNRRRLRSVGHGPVLQYAGMPIVLNVERLSGFVKRSVELTLPFLIAFVGNDHRRFGAPLVMDVYRYRLMIFGRLFETESASVQHQPIQYLEPRRRALLVVSEHFKRFAVRMFLHDRSEYDEFYVLREFLHDARQQYRFVHIHLQSSSGKLIAIPWWRFFRKKTGNFLCVFR